MIGERSARASRTSRENARECEHGRRTRVDRMDVVHLVVVGVVVVAERSAIPQMIHRKQTTHTIRDLHGERFIYCCACASQTEKHLFARKIAPRRCFANLSNRLATVNSGGFFMALASNNPNICTVEMVEDAILMMLNQTFYHM